MPFTTSFSAYSTHTASSFSILFAAVFQWPILHFFFSFYCPECPLLISSFSMSLPEHTLLTSTLSFSPQGHFSTFPVSLVTSLLFLSSVSRLKDIPETKPSPIPSVNSGIIFKHQSKQEGPLLVLLSKKKRNGQMRKKKQYSQEWYFDHISSSLVVVVWRSLRLTAWHQYLLLFCLHTL